MADHYGRQQIGKWEIRMKFTLPLAKGNYPFRLTENDAPLNGDDWAWSFLRLNPFYRYDFKLVGAQRELRPRLDEARRLINLFRMKALPADSPVLRLPRSLPLLPTELPQVVADLDSRYFVLEDKPLFRPLRQFSVVPSTLQEWLNEHGGIADLARLDIREFDAPRDYGISAWMPPDNPTLDRLKPGESWFHLLNEPIWAAGTWALRPSNVPRIHIAATGQKAMVGTETHTVVVKEKVEKRAPNFDVEITHQLISGRPVPLRYGSEKSTELYFLICLDGYVGPQLDALLPIAKDLKALHRSYFPKAVARGTAKGFVPVIEDPLDLTAKMNCSLDALFTSLTRAPSRCRKNWRAVTIDVAAPMVEQFENLTDRLIKIQDSLSAQLTFPLRMREGRVNGDHWLKKSLCVLELYFQGCGDKNVHPSLLTMARAFYDEVDPIYPSLRGKQAMRLPVVSKAAKNAGNADHPKLEVVKEALENAQLLALGWYEFIACPGRSKK
jgi:hypothetical protein